MTVLNGGSDKKSRPEKLDYMKWFNFSGQSMYAIHITTNCHKTQADNYTKEYKIRYYSKMLYNWDAAVSRNLWGKQFYTQYMRDNYRQKGFFVHEHAESNFHFHGLIDLKSTEPVKYLQIADAVWQKFVPSGDILIEKANDPAGVVRYMLKDKSKYDLERDDGYFTVPKPMPLLAPV